MNTFQMHTRTHQGIGELEKILSETLKQRLLVKYPDVVVTVQALSAHSELLSPPIASKFRFTFEAQVTTKRDAPDVKEEPPT